jgi:hypothetical protein
MAHPGDEKDSFRSWVVLPANPRSGGEVRDYDTICSAYAEMTKGGKMNDDLFGDVRDDSILEHLDDEVESSRFPSIL